MKDVPGAAGSLSGCHSLSQTVRRGPLRVWYRPDSPVPMTSADMLDCLESSGRPTRADVKLLKRYRRRSIFSMENNGLPIVIKAFPFERIKDAWRWRKYAPAELGNNLRAGSLGIPVPVCYGLFCVRRYGLVVNCGIVMEQLCNHTDLAQLSATNESQVFRAIPTLVSMYTTGVHHLDVNPSNFFFNNETGRTVIIDWQKCEFQAPRNDAQLVLQGAHFLNYSQVALAGALWTDWVGELHRQSACGLGLLELQNEIHRAQETTRRPGKSFQAGAILSRAA